MKKHFPIFIFLIVVALLGVVWYLDRLLPPQVDYVLQQPDAVELISLDPEKQMDRFREPNDPHAWKALGVLKAKTPEQRQQLVSAFRDVVARREPRRCFWPRHAIHATRGKTTVDLVICFECEHARAFVNNKLLPREIPVSDRGAEAFNQLLSNAKVPLPPKE